MKLKGKNMQSTYMTYYPATAIPRGSHDSIVRWFWSHDKEYKYMHP